MQDLTQGSIVRHLMSMAAFIAMGLAFQAAYSLVDLYFVSGLGKQAIAGVGAATNFSMLVMGGSQMIAVGAIALIAQATGRRDLAASNGVFNQAVGLAAAVAVLTLLLGYGFAGRLLAVLTADAPTLAFSRDYLGWFLPALACMFPTAALGSGLRATGVVRPTMLVQTASVLLNAVLAPVLIAGWGTGHPMGVAGAGLASTISSALSLAVLAAVLPRVQRSLHLNGAVLRPDLPIWGRLTAIGLPAAGELFMMFIILGVVYHVIRGFGPEAQAGFGIGGRIMQAIFLPAMAVAFAAAPVAGQNYGARAFDRVRETFGRTALIGSAIMLMLTLLCQTQAHLLVSPFTTDPHVTARAVTYLQIMSWNFVGSGLVFACSGMFQGLGNTVPSFLSSASRLVTFVLPAFWLVTLPGATLTSIWHLSVASVAVQTVISLLLLRRVFRQRLHAPSKPPLAMPAEVTL